MTFRKSFFNNEGDLQFSAPNHVNNEKNKAMAAQCQENSGLIEYSPHFRRYLIPHVRPSLGAWIAHGVLP